ncbi:SAC3/GANP domain protein [Metarhizium album ARSEF 1941]|uniref:SAC3/GANP domain protein n=1 Tax=Metarhizium album (strain ARSEF 1941) TaxID=1081103 RepID=A0A0B2WTL9_METAS|nr:SAC3/GANP domain protein [Metarhizium album ARSEF 1941]KHN97009.1 SAC3/GANP domain protein [Metarhizium album ARSEF 1941]
MLPGWSDTQQASGVSQQTQPVAYSCTAIEKPQPTRLCEHKIDRLTIPKDPAFVPVQVRQGFSQYAPPTPPPYQGNAPPSVGAQSPAQAEQSKPKTEWPESVRRYVQRSFLPENDDPSVSRAEVETKLKETIGTAKENGTLYTIDWDAVPMPQALVKADRDALYNRGNHAPSSSESLASRKRKSSDLADSVSDQPPWHNANSRSSLENRISYPSPDKISAFENKSVKSRKFQKEAAKKRKRRFESEYKAVYRSPSPNVPSSGPIIGTSEVLEKRYLRLTAPPIPSNVRPVHILRQTLDLLKKKWRKEGNYSYICDQFKSMRQDLTVQRIKNDFTVSVYEIHARIALEKGDIGNPIEFKAYRILYFIHTANRTGLNDTMAVLTAAEKEEKPIKHALQVRSALALGNYHKFFQLYLDTPNMGAYLLDMFVARERLAALCYISKCYKPDVKLRFVTEELAFESDTDAAQFIIDHSGQHLLEDRSDDIVFLSGKAGPLFESSRSEAFRKVDIKGQI